MNASRKLTVVIGGALLLTSCQQSLTMWVQPGSTAGNLVLGWSTSRDADEKIQPEDIRIFSCTLIHRYSDGSYYPNVDQAVWSASAPYDALPALTNRVTYGQGFASQRPAKPLTAPGCYVVIAYARYRSTETRQATMGFKIASDGIVTDMPRDEYENLFR